MVYSNQLAYYNAINKSSSLADSGPFIDFMLEEILNALIDHQGKSNTEIADEKGLNYQQVRVLGYLRADRHKQTVIVAGFILLLDLIMIVAFLVDYLRKS